MSVCPTQLLPTAVASHPWVEGCRLALAHHTGVPMLEREAFHPPHPGQGSLLCPPKSVGSHGVPAQQHLREAPPRFSTAPSWHSHGFIDQTRRSHHRRVQQRSRAGAGGALIFTGGGGGHGHSPGLAQGCLSGPSSMAPHGAVATSRSHGKQDGAHGHHGQRGARDSWPCGERQWGERGQEGQHRPGGRSHSLESLFSPRTRGTEG